MPRVFLNYRREDSAGIAGRLFDRLYVELGRENVFRDLDTLVPGADFGKVIADQVASCDALIAVIGKDWLTARDADGHRRLDQPGDLVTAEIREALARDKLVIPALVEGASIPKAADLPPDIAALAARNAIEISDSRFAYDTERLIRAVQAHTDGAQDPRSRPAKQRRSWVWVSDPNHQRTLGFIGAGIAAVAIAGWTVYVHFSDKVTPVAAPWVSASNGGIAAGRDLSNTAAAGGTAILNTGSNNTVTIGFTLEQYEAALKRREQEVREEQARTHRSDTDKIALLEKELAAAEAKRQNPEQALSDFTAKLAEASQALEKLKGDLPTDQLAEARQALGKGNTAAAEALFTEALAQGKAQAAAGDEKAADAAFQLGQLAYQRIDYGRVYDYFSEAAKLQPDNPKYLNAAGRIAHDLGRYAKAQTFYENALAIREKALGPEHPDVAVSLNNLAALYDAHGQYSKAEPLYQRALGIWEKALGPEHPRVATGLNNLAELYRTQGQYTKAEPLYQRAVGIWEKALGPEHPNLATSLSNLAVLYVAQGQYAKAEPLHQRALGIREKALRPEHPDVARSLNKLAELYRAQGQYGKAEPLYQRALRILEAALPSDHPDLAQTMANYAALLGRLDRDDEAKAWKAKADAARERHAGTSPGAE